MIESNRNFSFLPKEESSFSSWSKKDVFLTLCKENAENFRSAMGGHKCHKAGTFYAESFAFLMFCKMHDIDIILESGMGRGTSTEIWARNFSGPIITCEINKKSHHDESISRLSAYKNVDINFGDSSLILQEAIREYSDKRIAIFIDGPKDTGAVSLAKQLFKNDNVIFAGIHDVANPITKCRENYGFMSKFKKHVLSTDEDAFRDKFSYLDKDMMIVLYDDNGDYYESPEYTEHTMKRFPLGCGVGIALNEHHDKELA